MCVGVGVCFWHGTQTVDKKEVWSSKGTEILTFFKLGV